MKKFLTIITFLGLSMAAKSQLANNIVSYWKFDGNASDAVGSNSGTIMGATSESQGKINTTYSFDGTNDYISIPNSTSLNIQGNTITLSAWVYPTANKYSVIVSKIHNTGTHVAPYFQYTLQFFYTTSPTPRIYPRFGLSIGGTLRVAANTSQTTTLNQWHHMVGVYNGSTMKLYMDGVEIASTNQTGNIDGYNTPVYISEIGSLDGTEVFQGRIDEVGLWNRALSASEVTELYNGGSGSAYPFSSNYTLTASASPSAGGSVTLNPSGGTYASGTSVTASAYSNSGYAFTGWSGAVGNNTNPATITMDGNKTLSAIFTSAITYQLNITTPTNGTITTSPIGPHFMSGTSVTVTAAPAPGYQFSGWGGSLSGTSNPATLTMNANKTISATFTALPTYTLTLSTPVNGTITANPTGPNYTSGTTVTLTASPAIGYQLSAWGGSLSGSTSPTTLIMNGNKTVSATFVSTAGGSDNFGNHTATQNIKLGTFWLSSDGGNEGLRVDANGNIGIGIAPLASTLLTVNGKILAKEVEVVSSITSDYVFEPEYILMPLTELEIYVRKNKHLPNIPSAITFAKEGQNLAKMDDMLLRKVEELTLYILEQNKKIEAMQAEINALKKNKSN